MRAVIKRKLPDAPEPTRVYHEDIIPQRLAALRKMDRMVLEEKQRRKANEQSDFNGEID